jgi:hypothetical protein
MSIMQKKLAIYSLDKPENQHKIFLEYLLTKILSLNSRYKVELRLYLP